MSVSADQVHPPGSVTESAGGVVLSRRDEVSLAQHAVLGFVRNRENRVP